MLHTSAVATVASGWSQYLQVVLTSAPWHAHPPAWIFADHHNLILNRLSPAGLLGGSLPLYPERAVQAFHELGERLGMIAQQAAWATIRLANSNMDNLLRLVSVRRGFDPREFSLVAFGGGGSMHATALARRLHVKKVIVPVAPAVFSAWGMLMSDLRVDLVQTAIARTDRMTGGAVMEILMRLEREALGYFEHERIGPDRVVTPGMRLRPRPPRPLASRSSAGTR